MYNDLQANAKFPLTNAQLMNSPVYAGGTDVIITCHTHTLASSYYLKSRIRYVHCCPDAPVLVADGKLRDAMVGSANLQTVEEFKATLQKNPRPHDRPLCMGGFLSVTQDGEAPKQFLIKRKKGEEAGQWSQPRKTASSHPFQTLGQALVEECGLLALDDKDRRAIVIIPDFSRSSGLPAGLKAAAQSMDVLKLKQDQEAEYASALKRMGLGHYTIEYQSYPLEIPKGKVPAKDSIFLSYPSQATLHYAEAKGEIQEELRAYAVKDHWGNFHLTLPFQLNLPKELRLVSLDPQGQGRETRLATSQGLEFMKASEVLTKSLRDLMARPLPSEFDAAVRAQPAKMASTPCLSIANP